MTAIQQGQLAECVVQQEISVRVNQTTLEPNVTSVPQVTTASQSADVSIHRPYKESIPGPPSGAGWGGVDSGQVQELGHFVIVVFR